METPKTQINPNDCEDSDCPNARRMQAILNAMPDLVFIVDTKGYFTSVSQQADRPELYKPPSEWIGKHHSKVLPENLVIQFDNAFAAILKGSPRETLQYALTVQDGSTRDFFAIITPILNHEGEVDEICEVIRDITKEKQDLEEKEKMVKLLTGREQKMIALKKEIDDLRNGGGSHDEK